MLFKKLLDWLITPSEYLTKAEDVRRARILSAMLILLMIATPIGSLTSQIPAERISVGFLFYAICLAYFLSRTQYYVPAGVFAVISIHIPPYAILFTLNEYSQFTTVASISWMAIPIVLASVWLPVRAALSIWLCNLIILLIVFSFFIPEITFETFIIAFVQLLLFGALILFAAKLRNDDQDSLVAQTYKMEAAKNDAENANKIKSEFISVISHELRTPLTSIKGALGLLLNGVIDNRESVQEMLQVAYNNSERLTMLVNDILDFEKTKSGKMTYQKEPEDINTLIADAIESNKNFAEQYDVNFDVNYIDSRCRVLVDKSRIQQVMSNLLSNAVKYSHKGDVVHIVIQKIEDKVRVIVKDNGSGIPKEFNKQIFTPFSQADSTDTREKGGTGLGLAISKEIIENHGGRVGYESQEGHGAIFYFELDIVIN